MGINISLRNLRRKHSLTRKQVIDAIYIPREESSLLDVIYTQEFGRQSLQTYTESTMRRHTVFEGLQIVPKLLWIKTFALYDE